MIGSNAYVWGANVYRWPDGGGEAVVYVDHRTHPDAERMSRSFHGRHEGETSARDQGAASRRARTGVRRLVRSLGMRYMWTLTFPRATDRRGAEHAFRRFMRGPGHRGDGAARLFGGTYVAVFEPHPQGHGWHVHFLTNRVVRVERVREAWRRCLGVSGRIHAKRWSSARSASMYAAKYVSKGLADTLPKGSHRYLVGEGSTPPCPSYGLALGRDSFEALLDAVPELPELGARVVRVDTGAGPPAAWAGW